jgi:hypothetical protein
MSLTATIVNPALGVKIADDGFVGRLRDSEFGISSDVDSVDDAIYFALRTVALFDAGEAKVDRVLVGERAGVYSLLVYVSCAGKTLVMEVL